MEIALYLRLSGHCARLAKIAARANRPDVAAECEGLAAGYEFAAREEAERPVYIVNSALSVVELFDRIDSRMQEDPR